MRCKKFLEKIDSIHGFKIWIDEIIDQNEYLIKKNYEDARIINFDNAELLNYYLKEKDKFLNSLSKYTILYNIQINDFKVKVNEIEYNNLISETEKEYNKKKDLARMEKIPFTDEKEKSKYIKKIHKEHSKYYKSCLNDIENSIWLSYYNLNINELQEIVNIDNSKQSKNKHADIFKDNGFEIFLKWIEISNDEPYKKMSYIFQKLNSLSKISDSNFKNTTKWLIENNFIDEKVSQTFFIKGAFISPSNILLKGRNTIFNTIN